MPKQARKLEAEAPRPKRTRRPAVAAAPFRYIAFADLHVDAARLDRALAVLDRVGELAEAHDARPVCLGDFWDLRGHWLVRHVEEVLKRVEAWRPAVFIPGNHDQVSLDGLIHGLNIFRTIEHHAVATEPVFDEATRCAFLPWRERPEDQRAQFAQLEGEWTVFAHAEVGGAVTNGGHKCPGVVQVADIEAPARACDFGHNHKRQQLGSRTWYLGSPFTQNMGERDWPHGVALITHEQAEPAFIELDLPRYWRLSLGDAFPAAVGPDDVVELVVDPESMGTEAVQEAIESLPARDVRTVVSRAPATSEAPAFALTLDGAIEQWGAQSDSGAEDHAEVVEVGRKILGEIPEAHAVSPLGTPVKLLRVRTQDFCALRGALDVDLSQVRRALVQAPIRTGKTALLDAPMWALYGETTPRKAGTQGATLRADSVIHDDAAECSVECVFAVGEHEVRVRRVKRRGQGSKVEISGIKHPEGIADQGALIRHAVGLSHPLWRACVSLGQGAVSNFATEADKRRKDLLSEAFGLEACAKAQKRAKDLRDGARVDADRALRDLGMATAARDALLAQNHSAQAAEWDRRRAASVESLRKSQAETQATVEQCAELLKGEAAWVEAKRRHSEHADALAKRLGSLRPTARIAELQRQFGSVEAEAAIVQRDLAREQAHYSQLVSGGAAATCPACGQRIPDTQREQHLVAAENKVRSLQQELQTFEHRKFNLAQELDALNAGGNAEQQSVEAALAETRVVLDQCGTALSQFVRIRANGESAQRQWQDLQERIAAESGASNPFEAQARQVAEQIAKHQTTIDEAEIRASEAAHQLRLYEVWVEGFGPKGIPVLVLRTALYDLEAAANRYLAELLAGTVYCELSMSDDALDITYFETVGDRVIERSYEQLSGGQRRCVELAFAPFALADMIFARCGVRVSLLILDELTTHMGAEEKARVCALLERLDRDLILVADHDLSVQGHFDTKLTLRQASGGMELVRV